MKGFILIELLIVIAIIGFLAILSLGRMTEYDEINEREEREERVWNICEKERVGCRYDCTFEKGLDDCLIKCDIRNEKCLLEKY